MENNDYQNTYEQPHTNPQSRKKKIWQVIAIFVLTAAIAVVCGYAGTYFANENAGKVVIQKVVTTDSAGNETNGELSSVEVAQIISPNVVSITTEKMEVNQFWFGPQISSGAGSGVIISEDGYILTCAHVISGADTIMVTTSNGEEYSAALVGSYEDGDIAVLKIEEEGLDAALLGDSSKVQLGETVYAVGNPGGTLGGSITNGIISATERTITVSLESSGQSYGFYQSAGKTISLDVLQTNAAVSPGNSGGGLFNSRGELIGIVNAKSSGESQEGLGFAIPINTAQEIAVALINYGTYQDPAAVENENKAVLNISVAEVDKMTAQISGREAGVYVQSVVQGGASDGLLEAGDRIISLDENVITTTDKLTELLSEHEPGDSVSLIVERNGFLVTVDIVLEENSR